MKEASVNGHFEMPSKVAHDHLDDLLAAMRMHKELLGEVPGLWKSDIDSAYRRVPVMPEHAWATGALSVSWRRGVAARACMCYQALPICGTAFFKLPFMWPCHLVPQPAWSHGIGLAHLSAQSQGRFCTCQCFGTSTIISQQRGLCVAVSSVGARCVTGVLCRRAAMEHSMQIFARLVRVLLGESAICDHKLEFGSELVILGIKVCVASPRSSLGGVAPLAQVAPGAMGVNFTVCPIKADKWRNDIIAAIEQKQLDSGGAQKLAGRLSWSTQFLFHKLGRGMIKPIFAQKVSTTGSVGPRLMEALIWWRDALQLCKSEDRPWQEVKGKVCRVFVDAASSPAYCAAIAFVDCQRLYTPMAPPVWLSKQFAEPKDKQITTLVRCAIVVLVGLHYACLPAGDSCYFACLGFL